MLSFPAPAGAACRRVSGAGSARRAGRPHAPLDLVSDPVFPTRSRLSVMVAFRYHNGKPRSPGRALARLDQSALDGLLPKCVLSGISVVIGGVCTAGSCRTPIRARTAGFRTARRRSAPECECHLQLARVPAETVARAGPLRQACGAHSVILRAAAVQCPPGQPAVASELLRPRMPGHVEDDAAVTGEGAPAGPWCEAKARGGWRAERRRRRRAEAREG